MESNKDKEIEVTPLTDWLCDFLWHWQQSGVLHKDAAEAIISVLHPSVGGDKNYLSRLPTALSLIESLENLHD